MAKIARKELILLEKEAEKDYSVKLSVRMSKNLHKSLKLKAFQMNVSEAYLCREALKKYLSET